MGKVAEARFAVPIFAPHESEYVPEAGSEKAAIIESQSPVVRGILFSPEGKNLSKFFDSQSRDKLKTDFTVVMLDTPACGASPCRLLAGKARRG